MSTFSVSIFEPVLPNLETLLNEDKELLVSAHGRNVKFAVRSNDAVESLNVTFEKGEAKVDIGKSSTAAFTLSAQPEDWKAFFAPVPNPIYQSYWGMLRVLGHRDGVSIAGDMVEFGRNARIWRISLDRARDALNGVKSEDALGQVYAQDTEDDCIVGRYIWIETPGWGRSKVFYESAGHGPQSILLLHTAGADSRQFHSLMNNKELQEQLMMYAFDLPGHGRSYPGSKQLPQGYINTEEDYVESIGQVIKKLGLKQPIVSGASMAGHVCLAVAIRAKELGVSGVIPCEGCEHLLLTQPIYELPGDLDEGILNPERVCGMCSPTAPCIYKRLIWWIYSSQGIQTFHCDLKFYFRGWDGRGRIEKIDTQVCPVYMLTGEYDYSCTPQASKAAADKIPGAKFEMMKGLGHFPMTEDPKAFIPYMKRALDFIEQNHKAKATALNGSDSREPK